MESVAIIGVLAFLGLLFGSFAGAQVWRLRARQLRDEDDLFDELRAKTELSPEEQEELEYLSKEEGDRLKERARLDGLLGSAKKDYSRCLSCQHRLAWYDLLPLVSWASTGGKCRYCSVRIGAFEPYMELGVAGAFALSYILWPLPIVGAYGVGLFVLWLVALVLLAILFAYDLKWFLLPNSIVFGLMGVGGVMSVMRIVDAQDSLGAVAGLGGATVALSGLYFLLYHISKRQWVGYGDVKLGLGLALLLGDWQLAVLALFLANFIGSIVVLPGMLLGKLHRKAHVPFGPLLIVGAAISMVIGERILSLYLSLSF